MYVYTKKIILLFCNGKTALCFPLSHPRFSPSQAVSGTEGAARVAKVERE